MSTDSRFDYKMRQEHELSRMVDGGVPFPMLSGPEGGIGTIYGAYDDAAGVDIRKRFIIDPDFIIRAMEVLTPEVGMESRRTRPSDSAFQHVRKTGEVTPSGRKPGQPALKPGPDLSAKYGSPGNSRQRLSRSSSSCDRGCKAGTGVATGDP